MYGLLRKSPWKCSAYEKMGEGVGWGMIKINDGFYIKRSIHLLLK